MKNDSKSISQISALFVPLQNNKSLQSVTAPLTSEETNAEQNSASAYKTLESQQMGNIVVVEIKLLKENAKGIAYNAHLKHVG